MRATRFAETAKAAREASENARAQGMAEAAGVLSEIVDKSVRINDALKGDVGGVISGAEVQRTRIMETASAMTELNATAASIARTANDTADKAEEADRTAERGAYTTHCRCASLPMYSSWAACVSPIVGAIARLSSPSIS